jgi:hypothetical protein
MSDSIYSDSPSTTCQVEAATEEIIRILNSHNQRMRPSFEPDITNRPCSKTSYDPPNPQTRASPGRKASSTPKRQPISPLVIDLFPDSLQQSSLSPKTINPSPRPTRTIRDPAITANAIAQRSARSLSQSQTPPHTPPSRPSSTPGRRSMGADRPVAGTSRTASSSSSASTASSSRTRSAARSAAAAAAGSDRDFLRHVAPLQEPEGPSSAGVERGGSAASARSSRSADSNSGAVKPAPAADTPPPRQQLWERLRGCFGRARAAK